MVPSGTRFSDPLLLQAHQSFLLGSSQPRNSWYLSCAIIECSPRLGGFLSRWCHLFLWHSHSTEVSLATRLGQLAAPWLCSAKHSPHKHCPNIPITFPAGSQCWCPVAAGLGIDTQLKPGLWHLRAVAPGSLQVEVVLTALFSWLLFHLCCSPGEMFGYLQPKLAAPSRC